MLSWPDFSYKQIAIYRSISKGEKLRFRADNIIIENEEGDILFQHSCHRLFALFLIGEMSLTSVVIKKSIAFAFPIILMNANLKVIARINCQAEGNTLLRKKQYVMPENYQHEIAKHLIAQKIQNQLSLLKQLRHISSEDAATISMLKAIDVSSARDKKTLLGIEGHASKAFFNAYFRPLGWTRREPRCKRDQYNLLLDIGYTYIFQFIEAMLSLYGFDLYCGVYHTFFYQRKSLVCDLVEPFRCIIDRRLRKAYNLKQINPEDFLLRQGQYQLKYEKQGHYSKLFLKDILEEKESIFKFCQSYYRWIMQEKSFNLFPTYSIGE